MRSLSHPNKKLPWYKFWWLLPCNNLDLTYQHAHHVERLSQTLPLFVVADHLEVLHGGRVDQTSVELPVVAGDVLVLVKVDLRTPGLEGRVEREGKHLTGTSWAIVWQQSSGTYNSVLLVISWYFDYNEQWVLKQFLNWLSSSLGIVQLINSGPKLELTLSQLGTKHLCSGIKAEIREQIIVRVRVMVSPDFM